jgi:alanyl-tRNA synthetase
LMFTNAGIVQFKDVFVGKDLRPYKRATSSQKVIRISGKHNDLENVGVTARHHTFFEMLGNFSFGDYFKECAITYAWEFLTKVLDLPKERLVITVFGGDKDAPGVPADDEARAIWKKVTGFGDDRVIGMGAADNFWSMGDTGPCGPCTEIHFFTGDKPDLALFNQEPGPDGRGWMEIWNLVFMQFDRTIENGKPKLTPLPSPCVDTGAGLERIACVLQGKSSNYDTDVLRALVEKAAAISGKTYGASMAPDDISMRVIADHARTTAFLIAEGVFPDRAGRPYVLRRVMRRAIRHGHRLGIQKPFLHEVALEVCRLMGDHYPELNERKGLIESVAQQEEVRFRQTIDRGLDLIAKNKSWDQVDGKRVLPGAVAFKLYDTYGFPLDLTEVIGREEGFAIDVKGYEVALEEQRERSEGSKLHDAGAIEDVWRKALEAVEKASPGGVKFTGYEAEEGQGKVLALVVGGALVSHAKAGDEVSVVTDVTPFYGESGGQVGDRGTIFGDRLSISVQDTQKPLTGLFVHTGKVEQGDVKVGDAVKLAVNHEARSATRRNHSATHLLHWALRVVLGEQATQKGSLVAPDKLRFDYSHGAPLTDEEMRKIEDLVNAKILTNAPVETAVLPIAEARAKGAMAIFGDKYGDVVRVLTMTNDSVELCGGTHARSLGDIGFFKLLSDSGVAAGVRRIEAATGLNALRYVRELEQTTAKAASVLGTSVSELPARAEKLLADRKGLEKEIVDLKRKMAMGGSGGGGVDDMVAKAREIAGGKAVAVKFDGIDAATLRELAEKVRDKLGEGVVLAASTTAGKVALVVTVSKGLVGKYKAGDVIKKVAAVVGGSGGGRPDMAQAGGTQVEKLDEALAAFYASF